MNSNSAISRKRRSPLARRLIIYMILFSATITLVTTLIQLYNEYKRDLNGIETQFQQINNVHLRSFTQSLWATNYHEVSVQLEGLIKIPNIVYASVYNGGNLIAQSGKINSKNILKRQYTMQHEFLGKQHMIGNLTVVATLNNVYANLTRDAIAILISNTIRTLLVVLFLFFIFYKLVTRHITKISSHFQHLFPDADAPLVLNRKKSKKSDELDHLVSSTNAMQNRTREILEALHKSESHVRLLLDSTAEAIYGLDLDGKCTFVNPSCIKMLGYIKEDDLLGKYMHQIIHHTHSNGLRYPVEDSIIRRASLKNIPSHSDTEVHWRADGSSFPVEYWSHPILNGNEVVGTVVTFIDITVRKEAEEKLLRFRYALDSSVDAIYLIDKGSMTFIDANRAAWESLGYSREELLQLGPNDIKPEYTFESISLKLDSMLKSTEKNNDLATFHKRKDGSLFPVEISIQKFDEPSKNNSSSITLVAVARNVSRRKQVEEDLHKLAYFDSLTGLPNRTLYNDRLKHALAEAKRHNACVVVMLLDLDHFKDVNDTMGHDVGDRFLSEVATRLNHGIREADTLARLGGDEFALIFSDTTEIMDAALMARHLLSRLKTPIQIDGRELFASASIGITVYPTDAQDADSLLKFADSAMYHAKDKGRNAFQFYSSEMTTNIQRRMNLESDLHHALKHNEFALHFQPQVNTISGDIIGVEALIRWQDKDGNFIPPVDFIPLAEESGLIVPIGLWVLKTACKQLSEWHEAGYTQLTMSVNVASRQFREKDFELTVKNVIKSNNLEPYMLELEITESLLLENSDDILSTLKNIKSVGSQLAIDDFGTGYSSLSYLKRFPIDRVKIDQSFVRDLVNNKDDLSIVKAIIALANSLHLEVVAEGVETKEQLELLRLEGCQNYQGYYYARPMDAESLSILLKEHSGQ